MYFLTAAFAQTAAATDAPTGIASMLPTLGFSVLLIVSFYFLLIRPQQTRLKQHQTLVGGIKRGDTVVLSNGIIGKVVRVEDTEVGVEIATGVTVKVVKSMIGDVRVKGEVAANDAKS